MTSSGHPVWTVLTPAYKKFAIESWKLRNSRIVLSAAYARPAVLWLRCLEMSTAPENSLKTYTATLKKL
jgi:hypothetical protein